MRILFICGSLRLGGIETLIVRMSQWLSQRDHEVTVWALEDGPLRAQLEACARLKVIGGLTSYLYGFNLFARKFADSYDVIHTVGPQSMILGYKLSRVGNARLTVGAYHPAAFCFVPVNNQPHYIRKSCRMFASLPPQNIQFMNEPTKASHAAYYNKSFDESIILPLAIDDPGLRAIPRFDTTPKVIVSVGRLVDFKPYPLGVIDAVATLREKGVDLQYHIYGDGDKRRMFEERIRDRSLEDVVKLKGEVPYSELNSVLRGAFAFVGMGTSVVEAAILGVPSLVAPIHDSSGATSGWHYQQTGFALGEYAGSRAIVDEIDWLSRLSREEYDLSCRREREGATGYLIDKVGARYLEHCQSLGECTAEFSDLEYLSVLASGAIGMRIPFLQKRFYERRTQWSVNRPPSESDSAASGSIK